MGEYIVSARKYRPQSFAAVVGQSSLTTTLCASVKSGKLAHAYLFCGPRGVGKTTCARIFAKTINCQHPTAEGEACGECESCKAFADQRSLNIFELDAASNNGVEQIKTLMEQTRIPPQMGRYKVFIIDEVHMLSTAAFNAFLKTLEEPPAYVIFILATTEKHKILPTIISRCQIYDFERMTVADTIAHLRSVAEREGVECEEEALAVIAEKADGGMRDALSIFDQAASFCQGHITYAKVIEDLNVLDSDHYFHIVDLALKNDVPELMLLCDKILARGFDGGNMVNGLASHVRNVLMAKDAATCTLIDASERQRQRFAEQAQRADTRFLYRTLKLCNQCDQTYRTSSNKRLLVELTLIQVAQITQPDDDAAGAGRGPARLKSLFKKMQFPPQKPAAQVAAGGLGAAAAAAHAVKEGVGRRGDGVGAGRPATASAPEQPRVSPTVPERGRALFLHGIGVSFNDLLRTPEKPAYLKEPEEPADSDTTGRAFTQAELQQQWFLMCNRMPREMSALAARMKNMLPTVTEPPHVLVLVSNQLLLDSISQIKRRIRATLAKALDNNAIEVELRLADEGEIQRALTPREALDKLIKENKTVRRLCEDFDLVLA